jgi:glutamine---fructose-6-phosphate transaminase (isomerizing)
MRLTEHCSWRELRRNLLRLDIQAFRIVGHLQMRVVGMAAELHEAPEAVRRQQATWRPIAALIARFRHKPPQFVVTCARGSSAHAATFAKHLIERHLGVPVAAAAPSIASVYGQRMRLENQLLLTISQSGRSDDLVAFTQMAKDSGAVTVAIVNDVDSPLAAISDIVLPMMAGPELSVAATKSFIAALAMLLRMIAAWADDDALWAAIERLPERLTSAIDLDWTSSLGVLAAASSMTTIGRGPTLAIAREAALKLKETCGLQAEAFSSAEFQHGPMALVSPLYPVLVFTPTDAAAASVKDLATQLRRKGASLFSVDYDEAGPGRLAALRPDHADCDSVCLIQSFYALVIRIADLRGTDVNHPPHLQKVTRTR